MDIPVQRAAPTPPLERYTSVGDVACLTRHLERQAQDGRRACLVLRVAPDTWDVMLARA